MEGTAQLGDDGFDPRVILVAVDDSTASERALDFTISHILRPGDFKNFAYTFVACYVYYRFFRARF